MVSLIFRYDSIYLTDCMSEWVSNPIFNWRKRKFPCHPCHSDHPYNVGLGFWHYASCILHYVWRMRFGVGFSTLYSVDQWMLLALCRCDEFLHQAASSCQIALIGLSRKSYPTNTSTFSAANVNKLEVLGALQAGCPSRQLRLYVLRLQHSACVTHACIHPSGSAF